MSQVVVGMSGGVDSSVAAWLLKSQGYDVLAVFMVNWEDGVNPEGYRGEVASGCQWEQDYADVRQVCQKLDIPYTTFNFVEEYRKQVFDMFLSELKAGRTPNPDILCNQEIKFNRFIQKALALPNVEAVATGHYAKTDGVKLLRPKDRNKDQTYFLHRIDAAVLPKVLFPLADLTKDEVREIARREEFPNADKQDSTGICFIGDIDYTAFVKQYMPALPGAIELQDGTILGEHDGLHLYTIGQRRGIDIGGKGPYYVVRKDLDDNRLLVTNDENDPLLSQLNCRADQIHRLMAGDFPERVETMVRYRQKPVSGTVIEQSDSNLLVKFDEPVRAVTPGQALAIYSGDQVLGGGIISEAW